MSAPPEGHPSAAGRWFVAEIHHVPSRVRKALWWGRSLILYAATLGFHLAPYRNPGTIRLRRRDDGTVVARLTFDETAELEWRANDLGGELRERHVYDLCRDLRIPLHHVTGPGLPVEDVALVTWVLASRLGPS